MFVFLPGHEDLILPSGILGLFNVAHEEFKGNLGKGLELFFLNRYCNNGNLYLFKKNIKNSDKVG